MCVCGMWVEMTRNYVPSTNGTAEWLSVAQFASLHMIFHLLLAHE